MIRNMFTIAWRNARRHKQFSLLNILGLSIGITASMLIGLYVMNELSYDNFHADGDRIYRINQPEVYGDWERQFASTGPGVALALKADIPEFEEVTRLHSSGRHIVSYEPNGANPVSFAENKLFVAESNFFDVFSFPVTKGNADQALVNPNSLVITQAIATKYFGTEDPIGKTIRIAQAQGQPRSLQVTAVTANVPANSHIQYDMLVSMSSYARIKQRENRWSWTTFGTYGKVRPGTDIEALTEKIQQIPPKWAVTQQAMVIVIGKPYEELVKNGPWTLYLQPIREAYIHAPVAGVRFGPSGNFAYVQIFGAVGILILLLSSINFMNLSTARSANRAKEVGIRKTLGSLKTSLIKQFIFESVLFVLVSTVIALTATEVSLSVFNDLTDTHLSLYQKLSDPIFIAFLASFVLILGIAAGSYPAFYLSSFNPIEVLKGKLSTGFKAKSVRNGLVVFQFTVTIALIISALFVQKQLSYVSSADVGFDTDNILQVHNIELLDSNRQETFQTLLKSNAAFEEVGLSDFVPPNVWGEDKYRSTETGSKALLLSRMRANEAYLNILDLDFVTGRSFDKALETDRYKVILNETAVKNLGLSTANNYEEDSPIGKKITFTDDSGYEFEVIGVIKDFNFNSLKYQIDPMLIVHENNDRMWESGSDFISIRLNSNLIQSSGDMTAALEDVKAKLNEVNPGVPFEFSFMDQDFESYIKTEQQMGQVLNVFTIMALCIACLGLFGLAAFSAEQRKKELGVRKVLGASTFRLMYVFTAEFSILIMVSLVIASPLAYLFVENWLTSFAYKTPITPFVFVMAAAGSLAVAWLTIGFQSMRAANRNPVEVLRDA